MTDRPFVLDDLHRVVTPTETALSPDGTVVVFVRSEIVAGKATTSLWAISRGSQARRLTTGPADSAPRFSPDGTSIAFLRKVGDSAQLHLIPLTGGEAETLTTAASLPLGAGAAAWSPDGKAIAFAAVVSRSDSTDPNAPIVTDRLGYKVDGAGWLGTFRRHLHTVDLETKAVRRLTDGDWNADVPSWSPDGTALAFTANLEPDSDLNLTFSAYRILVDDLSVPPQRLGHATGVQGSTLWHPNGDSVVAIGTPEVRVGTADLIRLSVPGPTETPVDVTLTAHLDRNVMPGAPGYPGGTPALSNTRDEIVFCLRDRGWTHLYAADIETGTSRSLVANPNEVVSALSVARDARVASVIITTQQSFGEVALVDLDSGDVTTLTEFTAEALPEVTLFAAEEREFTISDGRTVHGWLLSAPETSGAAPLLLDIHGGPHNAWTGVADTYHPAHQVLAAQGWRILTLNPRGSDGYGADFMYAVNGAWGTSDQADFLEPIDALVAEGLVDGDRLAITGYSYGGYSTCHLTSATDRFAAAVAGGLICDFNAMAGVCDFGPHLASLATGTTVPENSAGLLAASPLAAVKNVVTPTLILHGKSDERCPLGQAEAWFAALRQQHVPTRLVAYPGASHGFLVNGSISHRIDYSTRLIEWVKRYTSAKLPKTGLANASAGADAWKRSLDVLCERYGVTGAQFGILTLDSNGKEITRTTVASGVINADTGVEVSTDSLFQIGSITKVWTAMLVMQLVDEGLLDLDATVRSILPDFALQDEETAARITVRALLNHRNGIDGDLFIDKGRGDDVVERYVEGLRDFRQVHPLEDGFAYSNSAYVLAARIVEVLRGGIWDDILKERIIDPLGLAHTLTLTGDTPRYSVAAGHTGNSVVMPVWPITRSMGPAGCITASIGDLLTFAELGLLEGQSVDGVRIVSEKSAAAMRTPEIDISELFPDKSGWGLGWFHETWSGEEIFGHDGSTIGQHAYLRIFPRHNVAIALLTSGGKADGLYRDLFTEAAAALVGLEPPQALAPNPASVESIPDSVLGKYSSGGIAIEFRRGESADEAVITVIGDVIPNPEEDETAPKKPATVATLVPSQIPGTWTTRQPGAAGWTTVRPHRDGVYVGFRFLPRVNA
ncbi:MULTISPECIES: serine hydrolase [Rhodococcus]|jgi:dipeptidyl aminopeptidase/acylaminoacyl peptidase/CubicO group peptidase (beta-lactamase class C family)|uniref:Serine hydrolase n=1 Tax=Rhodococcus baikonurensis TaxID=172041 RepID=A0ABV5XMC9_9NOCA|nr:serine hydrolase [Rhodococcus erythropolis]UJC77076.1 peptidase S9 [Rhodococcus erythropolis]